MQLQYFKQTQQIFTITNKVKVHIVNFDLPEYIDYQLPFAWQLRSFDFMILGFWIEVGVGWPDDLLSKKSPNLLISWGDY